MAVRTKRKGSAAKKTAAASKEVTTPSEITTKTIRGVHVNDKAKFQDLAEESDKTEGEFFSLLVNGFGKDAGSALGDQSDQIRSLQHELKRAQEQTADDLELIKTLRASVDELVNATGETTYTAALEAINALKIEKDLLAQYNGQANFEIDSRNNTIANLQAQIQEISKITPEGAPVTEMEAALQKVTEAIVNRNFKDFDQLLQMYDHNSKTVSDLSNEIQELRAGVKDPASSNGQLKLTELQFVAEITKDNLYLVRHYAKRMLDKKIISGDPAKTPYEVINWSIPLALKHTFAKLEVPNGN
jgi:hypothetical protein